MPNARTRAFLISILALAVPVMAALWFPEGMEQYEALLWLLALVPCSADTSGPILLPCAVGNGREGRSYSLSCPSPVNAGLGMLVRIRSWKEYRPG